MSIFIVKVTPIKLEQIWPKKYVSKKYYYDTLAPEFLNSGADFSRNEKLQNQAENRASDSIIRAPILTISVNFNLILQTPILSQVYDKTPNHELV